MINTRRGSLAVSVFMVCSMTHGQAAEEMSSLPAGDDRSVTFYVSKLGDNSDGSTWERAFTTVQAALDAIPDDQGGHHILVRPDTYMEANLLPRFRGAPGAYNVLEADFDGARGSGRTGYAVLDASDPGRGFKSVDWWGNFRASPEVSGAAWDRWVLRHVYATGGDGGLFWDLPPKIEPFTIVVEDSVGVGRAFGGGVGHVLPRADEPIVFRRCQLWCLDWWGDASGAYVRVENTAMPEIPDVHFEDCTLVGPDNALKSGNPGFTTCSRIRLKNCRLIVLNFSQPRGTPSTGIIHSTIHGKYMHVDLEDCTLMGYKVFGTGKGAPAGEDTGEITYTTKGSVNAYVQFEQPLLPGFHRLGHWPTEVFSTILPPRPFPAQPVLEVEGVVRRDLCEAAPVVWQGRLCLLECVRPASGGVPEDCYLSLKDADSSEELARFGVGHSLASAYVRSGTLRAFASRFEGNTWNDVTLFKSSDLTQWQKTVVIEQEPTEHLFNTSVCEAPEGFVMAYETDDPSYPAFSIKFARSNDLETWTKIPELVFGKDRYTACPCIRYANGYYYLLYLEHRTPRWFFETYIARSKDLQKWELSRANPVLTPRDIDDGINASDPELVELAGKTYIYYSVGDQRTWMNLKRALFPGPLSQFLEHWFPPLR